MQLVAPTPSDAATRHPVSAADALRWAEVQHDRAVPALLRVQALRTDDRVRQLMVHLNEVLPDTNAKPTPPSAVRPDPKLAKLVGCTGVRAYVDAALAAADFGALGARSAPQNGPLAGVAIGERRRWDGGALVMWRGPDNMPNFGVRTDNGGEALPVFSLVGHEPAGGCDATRLSVEGVPGRARRVPKWGDYDALKKAQLPELAHDQQKKLRDMYQLEYLEQRPAMARLFALRSAPEAALTGAHEALDFRRYVQELVYQLGIKDGVAVRPQVVRCEDGLVRVYLQVQDSSGQWRLCPTLRAADLAQALFAEGSSPG